MALFTWNDRYSVKIASIDDQHKTLFSIMNGLDDELNTGLVKAETVHRTLTELLRYTKTHLEFEEALLEHYGYPDFADHKRAHDLFVKDVQTIYQEYEKGPDSHTAIKLNNFLLNWLSTHINIADQKYSEFLVSKGAK